jgi:hypothetical protein
VLKDVLLKESERSRMVVVLIAINLLDRRSVFCAISMTREIVARTEDTSISTNAERVRCALEGPAMFLRIGGRLAIDEMGS